MKKGSKTAALMAAVLGITGISTGAAAAESYQEAEKTLLTEWVKDYAAAYGRELETYNARKGQYNASTGISLELDEPAKALLGMAVPADCSWLSDAKIATDISAAKDGFSASTELLVNGTKICSVDSWMDIETMDMYLKIPELSDGVAGLKLEDIAEESQDAGDESETPAGDSAESIRILMELSTAMAEYMPETQVLEDILNQYGTLVIEGISDGEKGTDTITADGVTQECTALEGTIEEQEAEVLLENLLTTMREDEKLKDVISKWSELEPEGENLYQQFQDDIASLLEETKPAENGDTHDDFDIRSKIWLDEEDKFVGRQISFVEADSASEVLLTWQSPAEGEQRGFLLSAESDGSSVRIEGSGTVKDSLLSGNYEVFSEETPLVNIQVDDYDTEQAKNGNTTGSYGFSLLPGAVGGDEAAGNMIGEFLVTATLEGNAQSGSLTLNLSSAGTSIGTLAAAMEQTDTAAVEPMDIGSQDTVYDTENEEDMERYASSMNADKLLENLAAAGMPDTFLEDIIAAQNDSSGDEAVEEENHAYGNEAA